MSRPVPVLYLIHLLGHGGSERQMAAMARTLDRGRFAAHVATVKGGFRVAELEAAGIPVTDLPLRSYLGRGVMPAWRKLRAYIREHNIAIVHAFDYSVAPLGVAVARTMSGVVALSSQRFLMDSVPLKYRYLTLAAHWMAHGVVANSEAAAACLKRYYYPASRIQVCHNGLDPADFPALPRQRVPELADADLVVGVVCVLRPEKNLGQLLEAFARVRGRSARMRLLIVGSGPEEARLRSLAQSLSLSEVCRFLPSTPDVAPTLRSIDIFVHPSLSEGLPNAVMEAMASGCAVIASRVGGCPELIEHGVEGLLVKPGDLDDLSAQLGALIDDPGARAKLAAAATARMGRDFSLQASARRLEQIYEGYLARAR
ncbi:MAG: glycosyltransferase [Bryobacteraceae bacterium]|jgi:glycosyltransferase involved in cell wall biosynthesis